MRKHHPFPPQAALRLALGNGWTLRGALPAFAGGPEASDEPYALDASRVAVVEDDLTPDLLLLAEIVAFTVGCAYLTKYGSLAILPFLESPNSVAAALCVATPPALVAATVLPRPSLSLPSFGGGEDGQGGGITYEDVKKYGVAGTLAYVLTELAFWAVAFPVAAALFAQTNGHAPDLFNSGADRAAVAAAVFAGANVARLAVPLRFGVALAAAPWVDENIVQKFGIGQSEESSDDA